MDEKIDIKSLDQKELEELLCGWGERAFRAKQIYEWLHVRQVTSFDAMTNISAKLRERLKEPVFSGSAETGAGSDLKAGRYKKVSVRAA